LQGLQSSEKSEVALYNKNQGLKPETMKEFGLTPEESMGNNIHKIDHIMTNKLKIGL